MEYRKQYCRILVLVFLILFLCMTPNVFFNHSHGCVDDDCIICSFLSISETNAAIDSVDHHLILPKFHTVKTDLLTQNFVFVRTGNLVLEKILLLN